MSTANAGGLLAKGVEGMSMKAHHNQKRETWLGRLGCSSQVDQ